jgi:hypothetical protein
MQNVEEHSATLCTPEASPGEVTQFARAVSSLRSQLVVVQNFSEVLRRAVAD